MLHLFDKVYITSDTSLDIHFDRVVMSQRYGNRMLDALDQVSYGELILFGTSFEETLGERSFKEFIDSLEERVLKTEKKIIIYADDKSFSVFMANWYKSTFKNISADAAWLVIDSYIQKQTALHNWRTVSTSSNEKPFSELTKTQFVEDFNNASSSGSVNNISMELLLANYMYNQTKKTELKESLHKILERSLKEIAIEVKHSYIKNKNKLLFPTSAKDEKFFTDSTLYKDVSIGQVSSLANTVDIINASEEDITQFKTIAKLLFQDWDQFKATSTIIKFLDLIDVVRKNTLTDADLNKVIQFEKTSQGTVRIFSSADEEKINVYFLDYVMNANAGDLAEYELQ